MLERKEQERGIPAEMNKAKIAATFVGIALFHLTSLTPPRGNRPSSSLQLVQYTLQPTEGSMTMMTGNMRRGQQSQRSVFLSMSNNCWAAQRLISKGSCESQAFSLLCSLVFVLIGLCDNNKDGGEDVLGFFFVIGHSGASRLIYLIQGLGFELMVSFTCAE